MHYQSAARAPARVLVCGTSRGFRVEASAAGESAISSVEEGGAYCGKVSDFWRLKVVVTEGCVGDVWPEE